MAYQGFQAVKRSAAASGARNPGAVAAAAGRAKYGAAKFNRAAAAGRSMRGVKPLEHAMRRAKVLAADHDRD